jgi:hypothetical protein
LFSKWIVRRDALSLIILVFVNGARCAPYRTKFSCEIMFVTGRKPAVGADHFQVVDMQVVGNIGIAHQL